MQKTSRQFMRDAILSKGGRKYRIDLIKEDGSLLKRFYDYFLSEADAKAFYNGKRSDNALSSSCTVSVFPVA